MVQGLVHKYKLSGRAYDKVNSIEDECKLLILQLYYVVHDWVDSAGILVL